MIKLFLLILTIVSIGISITCIWLNRYNKIQGGELVMDVGLFHKSGLYFIGFLTFSIFLGYFLLRVNNIAEGGILSVILAFFLALGGGVIFFAAGVSRLEFREHGLVDFILFIKWENIHHYEWDQQELTVSFSKGFPVEQTWHIPIVYKEDVDRCLANHIFAEINTLKQEN